MPMPAINLIGQKFGMLTVIERNGLKNKSAIWKCKCDCGNEVNRNSRQLRSNAKIKSCGCYIKLRFKTHGKRFTRLYRTWCHMKGRCNNTKDRAYINYGKRGIKLCKEWNDDFSVFEEWALNNGYSDDLTIERINVNGNYEPNNCKWIPLEEQFNNMTSNKFHEYNGKIQTQAQWSRELGISQNNMHKYFKKGFTIEQIIKKIRAE